MYVHAYKYKYSVRISQMIYVIVKHTTGSDPVPPPAFNKNHSAQLEQCEAEIASQPIHCTHNV